MREWQIELNNIDRHKKSKGPQSLTNIKSYCREMELDWASRKVAVLDHPDVREHRLLNAFIERYEEMLTLPPAVMADPEPEITLDLKKKKKKGRFRTRTGRSSKTAALLSDPSTRRKDTINSPKESHGAMVIPTGATRDPQTELEAMEKLGVRPRKLFVYQDEWQLANARLAKYRSKPIKLNAQDVD